MAAEPSLSTIPPGERASGVAANWVGQTLRGTYRILEVLDQGGMGAVFVAEHVRLRRRVAVKVLAQHLAANQHALGRFHREAEIISQLVHPNIVQVIDFDSADDGSPYLVMELLSGQSLGTRIEKEGPLPLSETVQIVSQVASGLSAAHRASVVHRDLKPGNVFLVELPDQPAYAKVLDFGISKCLNEPRGKLTGEFDILGTPEYMTPEQALGKTAAVDHRGDQYSLAIIAFEMLTGSPPFVGDDVMEILRKVIGEPPPSLSQRRPGTPPELDAVLARAMAKNPAERFDSVLQFASGFADAAGCTSLMPGRATPAPMPQLSRSVVPSVANRPTIKSDSQASPAPGASSRISESRIYARSERAHTPSSGLADQVQTLLDEARHAMDGGDVDRALDRAERATAMAEASSDHAARTNLQHAASLVDRILAARLGALDRRLVLCEPPSAPASMQPAASVGSPEQAFLLSLIDGMSTVDELLDMSPLPRQKTMRLLVDLLQKNTVKFAVG
jgi:serine/threonine protein kinase